MPPDLAPMGNHLIFNPVKFYIPTPMIDELSDTITRWLWCGATGGYVVGNSRAGKSKAIRKAVEQLVTRSGQPIPVFCMDFEERDRPTIASVFRNLATSLDLKIKPRAVTDELSTSVVFYLAEASLCNNDRFVILVVDEVQRATIQQLAAFAELYDLLVQLHTNLFVLFVANVGESDTLLKQLEQKNNDHIRGRFFVNGHYYHGLRNQHEVEKCLGQYDIIRYPEADGPMITECFLPTLYAEGWRLKSLSQSVWRVYEEQFKKPLKLHSWGMQYFTAAVKTLLVDFIPKYGVVHAGEVDDMITKSIEASGLVPSVVKNA